MRMETVLVYADAQGDLPAVPQVTAKARLSMLSAAVDACKEHMHLVAQALDSVSAGAAIERFALGNDREGANLVLLDAAAMCAYAAYRATIVAAEDPFRGAQDIADALQLHPDEVRLRMHNALCNAAKIISLGRNVAASLEPLLPKRQSWFEFPPVPLVQGIADKRVLAVVHPEADSFSRTVLAALKDHLPDWEFVLDQTDVFELPWYAAIHIGHATSPEPGSRLEDCLAGGVPVFQIIDPQSRNIRAVGTASIVTEDRGSRLCHGIDELVSALRDFAADPDAVRRQSASARAEMDSAAAWARIMTEVLQ